MTTIGDVTWHPFGCTKDCPRRVRAALIRTDMFGGIMSEDDEITADFNLDETPTQRAGVRALGHRMCVGGRAGGGA